MDDKRTPEWIVEQILYSKISGEEAVSSIKNLIEDARNESVGNMGETERKYFVCMIKGYYRDYGYPIKGSAIDIKDYLDQALEECGFSKLENVKNTKENKIRIADMIFTLKPKLMG